MDYKKIYDQLVEKCKVRGLDKSAHEGYFEIHHITPKCLGGSDDPDNLVMFTGREHFIAHMLLWRAYPDNRSLMRAAHIMSSRWVNGTCCGKVKGVNSKTYARLREEYAQAVSEQVSGEGNPFYGKTHSEETRRKFKEWHAANPDHGLKVMAKRRGITLEEAREIRQSRIERVAKFHQDRENGVKRELTPNQRAALLKANTGRVTTAETREKFSKAFKALDKQPWDTYGVFSNPEALLRWTYADLIKRLWLVNGSAGHKLFTSMYNELMGTALPVGSLKSMVEKFQSGWEPTSDTKWVEFCDGSVKDVEYKNQLLLKSRKSLQTMKEETYKEWLNGRESHRGRIDRILRSMGIERHKNNSKSSLSLVDVAEANILYKSNIASKKTLSELFGVKPNTVSQFTSPNLRFREVTDHLDTILGKFYSTSEGGSSSGSGLE